MQTYKCFAESPRQDLGDLPQEAIFALLREIAAPTAANAYGAGPYTLRLARSEDDFVEIDYLGEAKYLIWSDRLTPRHSGSAITAGNVPRTGEIEAVVRGEQGACDAVLVYIHEPRADFERKFG
jgi:hypothetical protein